MSETVLITGGTGRTGDLIVRALIEKGYNVVFTGRCTDKIAALESVGAKGYPCEFSDKADVDRLLVNLAGEGIQVNHVVNNFRNADNLKTDNGQPSPEQWVTEFQNAVVIPYYLITALAAQGHLKTVINVTSIYGIVAANMNLYDWDQSRSPIHYSVSKAAENHLTKELAVRLASQDVRVNAIAYGGIKGRATAEFEKKYADLCPHGGMIEEDDVPGIVEFLLSSGAKRITGQVIAVDGGWTIW